MFGFGKKEDKTMVNYYELWCEHCLTAINIDRKDMNCPDCGTSNMKVMSVTQREE